MKDSEIYFNKDIEAQIIKKLQQVKKEVYIMHFWFTYKPIIDILIELSRKGIEIKVLTDHRTYSNKLENINKVFKISALKYMWEHNIEAKVYKGIMMHHKVILIDNNITITGSCNLYKDSLFLHNENIIILEDTTVNRIYKNEFLSLFQNTMTKKEIEQVELKKKLLSVKIILKNKMRNMLLKLLGKLK